MSCLGTDKLEIGIYASQMFSRFLQNIHLMLLCMRFACCFKMVVHRLYKVLLSLGRHDRSQKKGSFECVTQLLVSMAEKARG